MVERANIVLACLAGQGNDEIAARLRLQANTVGIWRKHFVALGIMGLHDKARSGKPPTYDPRELRTHPQAAIKY